MMLASHTGSGPHGNRSKTKGATMTHSLINRRAAAILTATLTLGVAGPAGARAIDSVGQYSSYTAVHIPQQQPTAQPVTAVPSGTNSDLEYLLIGAGGAAVVMLSLGGAAVATHHHRHTRATARPTVAA
jgi:hypothetical protein